MAVSDELAQSLRDRFVQILQDTSPCLKSKANPLHRKSFPRTCKAHSQEIKRFQIFSLDIFK